MPTGPDVPTAAQVATILPLRQGGTTAIDRHGPVVMAPSVVVGAVAFRSRRDASVFLGGFADNLGDCLASELGTRDDTVTTRRIRFGLGDQRLGLVMTVRVGRRAVTDHLLLVREGRTVVLVGSTATGRAVTAKAVRLTRLALRTAR